MAEARTTNTTSEAELRALLRRIAQREERALTELHRRVGRRIYAFALNRLHDPGEALEVVNNVLFEIWKQPERFNGDCRFMTWALGIARYKMMHVYRGRGAEHEALDEGRADEAPAAFDILAGKELRATMLAAMERLTPEHREVIHLMYFEELSVAEVAAIQRCPVGTVKTRLHHARRRLRDMLDPSGAPLRAQPASLQPVAQS